MGPCQSRGERGDVKGPVEASGKGHGVKGRFRDPGSLAHCGLVGPRRRLLLVPYCYHYACLVAVLVCMCDVT